ncbi:hypothetical protein PVAND_002701 [Polypedilum vanderplanki]|uniref:INO80 complex subunit B-like conserved region domain-containing protein n=1 Tax=Polypedilum vanderplanki TaxID=319348 RepID=A0A9J6BRS5_POLVA|nr:hypothetical protein PVAND_002701 [Polypedilum vanderplanki]
MSINIELEENFTVSDNDGKKVKSKKYKSKKQKKQDEEQQSNLDDSVESGANTSSAPITPKTSKDKKKKKSLQPDDTSSDEERWLSAIEKGVLEQVDSELKNIKPKDPKLMTARQRAMYEKTTTEFSPTSPTSKSKKSSFQSTIVDGVQANVSSSGQLLLALPNFKVKKGKEKLPLTAEDIEKSKEKAQKRKKLADEKREKDKKKTMERILKKQDSKMVKSTKNKPNKFYHPVISYKNTVGGIFLSYPINYTNIVQPKMPIDPPKPVLCSISGCNNLKKYSCSKTNVPLCSLACYKKNVELVKQMIF